MKKLFFSFLILLFAVWIGFLIHRDPGYMLITYGSWSIEMSLWVGIILTIVVFSILHLLLKLFHHTSRLGSKLQHWDKKRKRHKSAELTTQGICELIKTDWPSAENHLKEAIHGSETPLVNYLSAAQAAHHQKAYDRRDTYLKHAKKTLKISEDTIDLLTAQFYLNEERFEPAIKILTKLDEHKPNQASILNFLYLALLGAEDWQQLQALLPRLRKYKVLSEDALKDLEEKIIVALLSKAETIEQLETIWQAVPRALRINTKLVAAFAAQAMRQQHGIIALPIIEHALKKQWDAAIVKYYGAIQGEAPEKQLGVAEAWLKKHPETPELLLCLAELSIRGKFWGKAKSYLEMLIQKQPSAYAYNQLANVCEALDEHNAALLNYRKAAQLIGA